jgi:hypothetical protein
MDISNTTIMDFLNITSVADQTVWIGGIVLFYVLLVLLTSCFSVYKIKQFSAYHKRVSQNEYQPKSDIGTF